jgi:hypothetical protein
MESKGPLANLTENKSELYLAAGPALQYFDEATKVPVGRIGRRPRLVYTVFLSAPLQDDYGFHPIASVYVRFQANALLVYTF